MRDCDTRIRMIVGRVIMVRVIVARGIMVRVIMRRAIMGRVIMRRVTMGMVVDMKLIWVFMRMSMTVECSIIMPVAMSVINAEEVGHIIFRFKGQNG